MNSDVTRRDFLRVSGAAAVGLAAYENLQRASHAAETPPHGLKKAVKYTMIAGDAPVLEKFELLKRVGYEGVDINIPLKHDDVLRAQDKTGVVAHGVVGYEHWGKPLSHPDPEVRAAGVESLKQGIRDAKTYGGTSLLVVPAVVNKEVSYADAYSRSQEGIRKLLPLAQETGIKILFENVWNNFLLSPIEMARYVDEFESEMVGVYFDVGNIVRYGWPEHWIHTLGKRIGKLDIKEYSRKLENTEGTRKGFDVEIGDGDCDWPAVMTALQQIGFQGWATAEVRGGDEARLRDIAERMDRVFSSAG